MPTMTEPRELFVHELGDVYYVEQLLVKTLPKLAREAKDAELRKGFEDHLAETKQQVENVRQVFKLVGESPKAEPCPGMDGIKQEHDKFVKEEKPSPEVLDLFLTGAGARTEHYEIAAYSSLITGARALGEREAVALLQENLKQEKDALKKMETAAKRLATQNGSGS